MQLQMLTRSLRILTVCATFVLHALAPASAEAIPSPLSRFQTQLALMSTRAPGHVGIFVKDITTGLSTGINAGANMPAASTIKIPVMVEVFHQMSAGDFDLNRELTLQSSDRDNGWGDLAYARSGTRYSVAHLLQLMITQSDNTATNMLIRFVGRVHINRTMESLGLRQTRLADYIRSDGDIRSLRTSALDMTDLLDAMAHDRLIDAWSSRAMISILSGQHHNGLLPQPLPPGTTIAHKTGTLHDTLNDVGIVYLDNAPYIIAVFTTQLPTLDAGRRFIRGVSKLAYNAIERFALWREANPLAAAAGSQVVPPAANALPPALPLPPAIDDGDALQDPWAQRNPPPVSQPLPVASPAAEVQPGAQPLATAAP